jgi:hypothetical protein
MKRIILFAATLSLSACATARMDGVPASVGEVRAFWETLQSMCGNAYEGGGVHVPASDTAFTAATAKSASRSRSVMTDPAPGWCAAWAATSS